MDIQPIVDMLAKWAEGLLMIALPILTAFIIAWLKAQYFKLQSQIAGLEDDRLAEVLDQAVMIGIRAAEQLYRDQTNSGGGKLNKAVQVAQEYLAARGVKVNMALLLGAIEAEVNREFPHEKESPEPE